MLIMRQFDNKHPFNITKLIPVLLIFMFLLVPLQANATIISEEVIDAQEKPGVLEKQFSKFVLNVANSLIGITGAQDVSVLVFQRPEVANTDTWISNTNSSNRSDLVFGIFPEGIFNGIANVYDTLVNFLPIPIVIIITLAGLFLLFDTFRSTDNRSQLKEYLLGLIAAILLLRFGYLVWDWIIFINYSFFVDPIYFMLQNSGIQVTSFISTIWDQGSTEKVMSATNFMVAIIVACAAFMTFSINYQYMLRIIMLGVLIVQFPVAVLSTIMPSRRNVLNQWFMLFTTQVTLQGAHAIALGIFFLTLATTSGWEFWICMAMFFGLPMITDLNQRFIGGIFGDSNSSGGVGKSFANASGITSMLGMAALGKNMMKSKGSTSSESSSKKATSNNSSEKGQQSAASNQNIARMTNSNEQGIVSSSGINQPKSESSQQNQRHGIFGNSTKSERDNQSNSNPPLSTGTEYENTNAYAENGGAPISDGTRENPSSVPDSNASDTNYQPVNQQPTESLSARKDSQKPAMSPIAKMGSKTGRKISNISRGVGNSEGIKRTVKLATMGGLVMGGAAIGTMITGNPKGGALVGSTVGFAAGKGAEFGISKGAKFGEVGGEVLQSKSEGNQALDVTKQRIGYHDQSQLADSSEMSRMGQELIGGKTGSVLGKVAGKVNHTAGKYDVSPPATNNYNARQNYETVQEREKLVTNTIPISAQKVGEAKTRLDDAQQNVALLKARAAAEPSNPKLKEHVKIAEQHRAKMQVVYETRKTNHAHLENKAEQFYERQKLKRDFEDLGQSRKSSGKLS